MGTRRGGRAQDALMVMMAIATTGALVRSPGPTTKYDAELQRLKCRVEERARQAEGLDPRARRQGSLRRLPDAGTETVQGGSRHPRHVGADHVHGHVRQANDVPRRTRPGHRSRPSPNSATSYAATASVGADAMPAFVLPGPPMRRWERRVEPARRAGHRRGSELHVDRK